MAAALASREAQAQLGRFYLPELDSLRFFAFLCVFAFHLRPAYLVHPTGTLESLVAGIQFTGALGVDIFFTLSAFLLSELLSRERERFGQARPLAFYIRRGLRIWPLYFAYLALALVLTGARSNVAICALFVGNFFPWVVVGPIFGPLWSLCIEEQFYLVWPWIVRFCTRARLQWVAGSLWGLSVVYRGAILLITGSLPGWGNTLAHLDPIACGIMISAIFGDVGYKLGGRTFLALAGTSTLVVAGLCHVAVTMAIEALTIPLAAVGAGAIMLSAIGSKCWLMNNRTIIYLGRISYGLYLFHCPVLIGLDLSPLRGSLMRVPLGLLLTIVLASTSYRWLESPFLNLKRRFQFITTGPPCTVRHS